MIARGNAKIYQNGNLLDVLGKGQVFGEISALSEVPPTTTVVAETPVSVLRLTSLNMQQTIRPGVTIEDKFWQLAAPSMAEKVIKQRRDFAHLNEKELEKWILTGNVVQTKKVRHQACNDQVGVVLTGKVIGHDNTEITGGETFREDTITMGRNTRVYLLPEKKEKS